MIDINGQVAFLTGAAEGLGREIARELVAGGMRVALLDVQADKLHRLADGLRGGGADVFPVVVDLADAEATRVATEQALAHYGTPRVLIHNAAVLREVSMLDVTFDDWRREVDIILQAAFVLTKTVWSGMVEARSGSVVFLSSGSALFGFVKETAYTPGKHAQEGLMKVLAIEGKEHGIAVNTMSTGRPIDTPMSDSHYTDEMRIGIVPPDRLAPAFAFLAGIDADFATGQRFNAYQVSEAIRAARG
ncbi:SDR family NAD(P)-dependent oxidoreductase [Actinokineospora terrae]|uniref:3-oxoacyl-[acyl-carrier protein] reductase n=1 Tax=Actinokineospora terrae TaxID=155974 RepID=A0A1H9XG11_9PSEU|nr:SDR family oxidoreductase [Actinokineospora terrae]SES45136.1 3-oxoacyl-[acyl-carrier protein] reductase [Actinokineospora terrae]